MRVTGKIEYVRDLIRREKLKNRVVGFVPTMGALHEGHLSLVRRARKDTDFLVVSIFVNPTQFLPHEDYRCYPRQIKEDCCLLRKEGVDLVFVPSVKTMYPKDYSTYVEELSLSRYLCGRARPGHFRGVCTVVTKLFNIIQPDISYFGEKDYQQARIIIRMVRDLQFPVKIRVLPIVRDKDNLALSSRNSYLSPKQRKEALSLFHSLQLATEMIKKGECKSIRVKRAMRELILKEADSAKIDYIEIVDPYTLEEVDYIQGKVLIALAVYIGKTRLIDNKIIRK